MRAREYLVEYNRQKTEQNYGDKIVMIARRDPTIPQQVRKEADVAQLVDIVLSHLERADPTRNKEYTQGLAKLYATGGLKMEDATSTLADYLTKFHKLKVKRMIPSPRNDFLGYKHVGDFMSVVDEYPDPDAKEETNRGQAKEVYNDAQVRVIQPEDRTAACYYGQGTRWCTAAKNNNMFDHYAEESPLYIVIPKKPKHPGEKYQIHFDSRQFMDENDRDANMDELVGRYPQLGTLFHEEAKEYDEGDTFAPPEIREKLKAEQVAEAFDQPYPVKWEKGEFGDYDALATLSDGTYLSIMFNREEDGEYQIEFHRNHSQDVTGEGDAQRVFATVLGAIQQFIKKQHPELVRFSATKDDDGDNQSRSKLYDRLVQRYANSWGYSVDVSDYAGSTVYELTNDLNEAKVIENQQVSTEDMINYIRKHHDNNLHSDYTSYIANTFTGFELEDVPVHSIKTDLPKLDRAKVEQYKTMDFSKAPPIVIGDGFILDGYHRANVAKALGIPTIRAYVGVKQVAEGQRQPLDFDSLYGKVFKITDNNGNPNTPGFSIVTPLNGASWNWQERPEFKKIVKQKLNDPGFLGDHKYQQIVDAMAGKLFDPAKHLVKEITAVPTVAKSKREHLDVMPNDGRPIPRGDEEHYLGKLVADMGHGLQLWSWTDRGTVTYYVFDTNTRTSQLGTTGRPYTSNRNSFVVQGVYSGPKNQYRAADLYAFLILNQGLTLVSDNKQSAGGYRVWQELEQRYGRRINIHGFDTSTDQGVNVTTKDEPDTHVARGDIKKAGPQMKRELGTISRDLRFVASAR